MINAFTSGNSKKELADLFPADQAGAEEAYLLSVASYPTSPSAPAATVTAQGKAIVEWWDGSDAAGQKTSEISVPTLVADGTRDRLDPAANDHAVVKLIPGARLSLFSDAGHAFLFQDEASVVPLIDSFLRASSTSSASS